MLAPKGGDADGWQTVRQYVVQPVADRERPGSVQWRNAGGARYVTYLQDAKVVTHVTADRD